MCKQFFIEQTKEILEECAQIDAKNRIGREKLLAGQSDFQKRFADTQVRIQKLRESVQKTM